MRKAAVYFKRVGRSQGGQMYGALSAVSFGVLIRKCSAGLDSVDADKDEGATFIPPMLLLRTDKLPDTARQSDPTLMKKITALGTFSRIRFVSSSAWGCRRPTRPP
jgi:hypothetical protein